MLETDFSQLGKLEHKPDFTTLFGLFCLQASMQNRYNAKAGLLPIGQDLVADERQAGDMLKSAIVESAEALQLLSHKQWLDYDCPNLSDDNAKLAFARELADILLFVIGSATHAKISYSQLASALEQKHNRNSARLTNQGY